MVKSTILDKALTALIFVSVFMILATVKITTNAITEQEVVELRRDLESSNKMIEAAKILMERYEDEIEFLNVKCGDR